MSTIISRLDLTEIFCDVDNLCSLWEKLWQQVLQLPSITGERRHQFPDASVGANDNRRFLKLLIQPLGLVF